MCAFVCVCVQAVPVGGVPGGLSASGAESPGVSVEEKHGGATSRGELERPSSGSERGFV